MEDPGSAAAVRVRVHGGDVSRDQRHQEFLSLLRDPAWPAVIPVTEIPVLVGDLERLKALLFARLLSPDGRGDGQPPVEADRWLCAEEAAGILNVTPRWLYRHHKKLPFARRLSRKALRFSEAGLRKWLAAKRA